MTNLSLLEIMSKDIDIPISIISKIVLRAPYTYKTYDIDKKNGGKRTISQPAKETKYLQTWLIENVFGDLPIHKNATAYKKGASIKKNAQVHAGNPYLVKYDFRSFFTSIKATDIFRHLNTNIGHIYSSEEMKLMTRVVCKQTSKLGACLSIGAPSSPVLSNSIMYPFDILISEWCSENGFLYTRYADDLAFSTKEKDKSKELNTILAKTIRELSYPKLRLNRKKTLHLSRKTRRSITGITITNEGKLSLGRDRKRNIRAMIHRYMLKELGEKQLYHLQGLLGFAKDIEPLFLERMKNKYGKETIAKLLTERKPRLAEQIVKF